MIRLALEQIGCRDFRTGPASSLLGNTATSDAHGEHRYHQIADEND